MPELFCSAISYYGVYFMKDQLFCKGFTWGWCGKRGDYQKEEARISMQKMHDNGCDWIGICFYALQDRYYSTKIYYDYETTPADKDIATAISMARSLGMKVCLKPVVNCADDVWRARISFPIEQSAEKYWREWFKSYTNFILHYAEIAQDNHCEMFCIGCEMVGTEYQYDRWVQLIEKVRSVYTGLLIYNLQHNSLEECKWLDKLDVVGISAYYPVGRNNSNNSAEAMCRNWEKEVDRLEQLSMEIKKPIIFIEIGCQSVEGASISPWNAEGNIVSQKEQADFYESAFRTFYHRKWFAGYFWWDWRAVLYDLEQAKDNKDFNLYGKEAELVLRNWYTKADR
jgi:hypothetical protein